jgi:hypothetical protein
MVDEEYLAALTDICRDLRDLVAAVGVLTRVLAVGDEARCQNRLLAAGKVAPLSVETRTPEPRIEA